MESYNQWVLDVLETLNCPQCTKILRYPVILFCGQSIYRDCHDEIQINSSDGLWCCCPDCGAESVTQKARWTVNQTLWTVADTALELTERLREGQQNVQICSAGVSDRGTGDTRSECSIGTPCSTASIQPSPNMGPDRESKLEFFERIFFSECTIQDNDSGRADIRSECSVGTSCFTASIQARPNMDPDMTSELSDWVILPEYTLQDNDSGMVDTRSECSVGNPCSTASILTPPNMDPDLESDLSGWVILPEYTLQDNDSGIADTRSECSLGIPCSTASIQPLPNMDPDLKSELSDWVFVLEDAIKDIEPREGDTSSANSNETSCLISSVHTPPDMSLISSIHTPPDMSLISSIHTPPNMSLISSTDPPPDMSPDPVSESEVSD